MTASRPPSHDERLSGVRAWLASEPALVRREDYDIWTGRRDQAGSGRRWVASTAILHSLALSWSWVLRVADGEYELGEARRRHLDELTRASGPLRLIGIGGIALVHGTSRTHAEELTRGADFPPPVAVISGTRVWSRRDVEAHHRGRRVRRRQGELQPHIMDTAEAARRLGLAPARLLAEMHRPTSAVPPPAGSAAGKRYWLRHDFETWLARHHPRVNAKPTGEGAGG